jgi:hypothetical protein
MKNASAATQVILSSAEYLKYELWNITLATGQTYYFTSGEVPLNGVTIYMPGATTIGPFNYQTGLTIVRDTLTQKAGTESGSVKVALIPQGDSPFSSNIAGYPIMQAARYGFLDGATVLMSKCFLNPPQYTNGQLDLSPGAMGYFLGTLQGIEVDRFFLDATIEDYLSLLGAQQMPKNLISVGCFHQVYDAGCGLLAATFTVSGSISTAGDGAHFTTNLTQVSNYFNLGALTMTSGAANGQKTNVSSYKSTSGAIALANPFSVVPSPGDTFNVYPGCDRQQATCSNNNSAVGPPFNNLKRNGSVGYMPVPETILDGGTDNPPLQTPGSLAGQIIGSAAGGRTTRGTYKA